MYKLSTKRKDTGKYWTFGSMKQGDDGYKSEWNIGIRVTPEFLSLVNAISEGGWLNLSAFPDDDKPKQAQKPQHNNQTQGFIDSQLDDEIGF